MITLLFKHFNLRHTVVTRIKNIKIRENTQCSVFANTAIYEVSKQKYV